MARNIKTLDYDPRKERAQTVEGAKARYLDEDLDYGLDDMEKDVGKLLVDKEGFPR